MIVTLRHCHRGKSTNIVKNGKNRSETQTYKCKDCGCYRWIVPYCRSRHILTGSVELCKKLWRKGPYEYLRCVRFGDFWWAHPCLPANVRFLVGKETGLTGHVKHLNNAFRRRVNGPVDRALFFSKKEYLLRWCIKLVYN